MASKQTRPPLGPADARYAGLGPCGWHRLEWSSQSREGVTHRTYVHEATGQVRCSCEGFAHRGECKHSRAALDTLAYHLGEPPPADPGGAHACRPCWHCPTRAYCAEHGCRYEFAASAADPDGAVGEPPALARPTECEDAARVVARRDPLDNAILVTGSRWIASRSTAGRWPIVLSCASCGRTRGWRTDDSAISWLMREGLCSCGDPGPPPPAPGAARKPLDECLHDLYGPE